MIIKLSCRSSRLYSTLALSISLLLTLILTFPARSAEEGPKGVDVEAVEKRGVRIWTEKRCGAAYEIGEKLIIKVRSERSGYLTIYDLMPNGEVQILFPNRFQQDNYIQAGKTYEVPAAGDPFRLKISPPRGVDYLLAAVTEDDKKLVREDFSYYSQAFPKLQDSRKEVLDQVKKGVDVIPEESWWAADSCHLYVGRSSSKPGPGPSDSEPPLEGSPSQEKMEGRVLVIGINDYSNENVDYLGRDYQFPPLKYSVSDARDMKEHMEKNFTEVKTLINERATYENIKEEVNHWLAAAGEDELAVLYFSGHGAIVTDMNGDEPDGLDEVLVPYGYSRDEEFIIDDQVNDWLSGLPTKEVVYIADSCHAGTSSKAVRTFRVQGSRKGGGENLGDGFGSDLAGGDGSPTKGGSSATVVALEASQPGQNSHEDDKFRQGVFTHYLLEGLKGEADFNGDGRITTKELFEYSKDRVEDYTEDKQVPMCTGCERGNYPLSLLE